MKYNQRIGVDMAKRYITGFEKLSVNITENLITLNIKWGNKIESLKITKIKVFKIIKEAQISIYIDGQIKTL